MTRCSHSSGDDSGTGNQAPVQFPGQVGGYCFSLRQAGDEGCPAWVHRFFLLPGYAAWREGEPIARYARPPGSCDGLPAGTAHAPPWGRCSGVQWVLGLHGHVAGCR